MSHNQSCWLSDSGFRSTSCDTVCLKDLENLVVSLKMFKHEPANPWVPLDGLIGPIILLVPSLGSFGHHVIDEGFSNLRYEVP